MNQRFILFDDKVLSHLILEKKTVQMARNIDSIKTGKLGKNGVSQEHVGPII
jgi:hypothetical protein